MVHHVHLMQQMNDTWNVSFFSSSDHRSTLFKGLVFAEVLSFICKGTQKFLLFASLQQILTIKLSKVDTMTTKTVLLQFS
jgi:hypothetical protein